MFIMIGPTKASYIFTRFKYSSYFTKIFFFVRLLFKFIQFSVIIMPRVNILYKVMIIFIWLNCIVIMMTLWLALELVFFNYSLITLYFKLLCSMTIIIVKILNSWDTGIGFSTDPIIINVGIHRLVYVFISFSIIK